MKRRVFKKIVSFVLLFNLFLANFQIVFAFENINSIDLINKEKKYIPYDELFLNEDKYENFNRRMFNFNLKLNKLFVKKIHILWASIMPVFMIDAINNMTINIEYPKRAVSCLLQRDFDGLKHETKRFIINTTLGVAGLIDTADKLFKLELYNEDMEQALAKCKIKCGKYIVLPFVSSVTTRDITGRILDFFLTPTTYIASPIAAAVKLGLLINRTTYIQPLIKMVESNFVDPYSIARKFYGVEKYIKLSNYDRKNVIKNFKDNENNEELVENKKFLEVKGAIKNKNNLIVPLADDDIKADIILENYNPQNPVTDSMRTAIFSSQKEKRFFNDLAIWNRDFKKKIKSASVNIDKNCDSYKFHYLLQKKKTSPLAIIFPSIGESIDSSGAMALSEIFYNQGYSVVIIGSHFQWEFLKSLKKDYRLGKTADDVKKINKLLDNIIAYLSKKYDRTFFQRTAIGTSLGASAVLFLANNQYQNQANNIDKFIAICPPIELMYAISQVDKIISSWKNYPDDMREKTAYTTAKVMDLFKNKENFINNFSTLPFSEYESKLISAFLFHQKLSDLVYSIEHDKYKTNPKELHNLIYNTDYSTYLKKYLLSSNSVEDLNKSTSLLSLSDYFINKNNYKIYHSVNDYLTNKKQLSTLKQMCEDKLILFDNGSHLGFTYRDEFLNELKKEIAIKK